MKKYNKKEKIGIFVYMIYMYSGWMTYIDLECDKIHAETVI